MIDYSLYLTKEKIRKIYRLLTFVNLGVGLIFLIYSIDNLPIEERLSIAIVLNIGFHMFFHLISIVPMKQLNWVKENKNVQNLAFKSIKLMTYFIPISCIITSILILIESIGNQKYQSLSALLVFSGVILGAIKLNLKLIEWKKNALQHRV